MDGTWKPIYVGLICGRNMALKRVKIPSILRYDTIIRVRIKIIYFCL